MDKLVINTKDNIITFLEKASDKDVMKYFFSKFDRDNCNYNLGEGHSAKVLKEVIGPTAKIEINGVVIEIPVVKKVMNLVEPTYIKQVKKDIFIYGENATGEVLILMKFRQLHSPHLHTLIDYACCGDMVVPTELTTEEHGLPYWNTYLPERIHKLNWKAEAYSTNGGTLEHLLLDLMALDTNSFPNNTKFELVPL